MSSIEPDQPPPRSRLAVVEDDDELRERTMLPALCAAGFAAVGLSSALQLYRTWAGSTFDMVLLDVGLPDGDGVEIAGYLRSLSSSLGIVLYAGHGGNVDRIRGLRAGVDACLVKPLDMEELVETLRNVQGRQAARNADAGPKGKGWSLDRQGWALSTPSGVRIALNQAERQVMGLLAANPSAPISRKMLIANLTGDVNGFDPHRLEMLIYRLRRKCLYMSGEVLPLQTVRGVGYLLES